MKVFYRISEGGINKNKLKNATKKYCLLNAIKCFPQSDFVLFVDNITDETWKWLNWKFENTTIQIKKINAGTEAGSMRELLKAAIELKDDELIYFLEDDYLHLNGAEKAMIEAIDYADYVSCYTHPDKFIHPSKGGNPYTPADNISEQTQVIKTKNYYWMLTNSTTCSFSVRAKTIKEDIDFWMAGTTGNGTLDFDIFIKLRENGRKILMPIPSLATHCLVGFQAPTTGLPFDSWEEI